MFLQFSKEFLLNFVKSIDFKYNLIVHILLSVIQVVLLHIILYNGIESLLVSNK